MRVRDSVVLGEDILTLDREGLGLSSGSDGRGFERYLGRPARLKNVSVDAINDLAKRTFEQRPVYQLILQ